MAQATEGCRAEVSALLGEIEQHHKALAALGIDARQPEDREAFDIISRIERALNAMPRAKGEDAA